MDPSKEAPINTILEPYGSITCVTRTPKRDKVRLCRQISGGCVEIIDDIVALLQWRLGPPQL